jgi:hypothetical protein
LAARWRLAVTATQDGRDGGAETEAISDGAVVGTEQTVDKATNDAVRVFVVDPTESERALGGAELLGVGRLSDVIGVDEARVFFDRREHRQRVLYARALRRWNRPYRGPNRMSRSQRRAAGG